MPYRRTREADQDIVAVYSRGFQQFGATQEERYQEGLVAAFDRLADNPRIAPARPEFDPAVRLYRYGCI